MKRIYHTETEATLWRGEDYLVDGVAATVEGPLVLLVEVTREAPQYDPATHRIERVPAYADIEAGEWVAISFVAIPLTDDEVARITRSSGRAALRAAWDSLPSWIRGPYRDKFEAANRLLDEGDDEAARDLIKYAVPLPDSEETPAAFFELMRAQMMAGIDALPK